jgi:hypothetical protein
MEVTAKRVHFHIVFCAAAAAFGTKQTLVPGFGGFMSVDNHWVYWVLFNCKIGLLF